MTLEDLASFYQEKEKFAEIQGKTKEAREYAKQAAEFLNQALTVIKARFSEKSPHCKRIQLKIKDLKSNLYSTACREPSRRSNI